jgi:hypothetical protein
MFEKVSGPSRSEIAEAMQRLTVKARETGGQIRVRRGQGGAAEEENEWLLMNLAAEQLQRDGVGELENESSESFEFLLYECD